MGERVFLRRVKGECRHLCVGCYVYEKGPLCILPRIRPVDVEGSLCQRCEVFDDHKIFKQVVFKRIEDWCPSCFFFLKRSFRCSFPRGKDPQCQGKSGKRNTHKNIYYEEKV